MLEIQRYKIAGASVPMYMAGCESLGTVYRRGRAGSIIQVARIEGRIFDSMKEAEAHCWSWRRSGGLKGLGTLGVCRLPGRPIVNAGE